MWHLRNQCLEPKVQGCIGCGNSVPTLVTAKRVLQTALQTTDTPPADVYECVGSSTSVKDCLSDYMPFALDKSGCQLCKIGFKQTITAIKGPNQAKDVYGCVPHEEPNCDFWDDEFSRCLFCKTGFVQDASYKCNSATQNLSGAVIPYCEYQVYVSGIQFCAICETDFGPNVTGSTCVPGLNVGCLQGIKGKEPGTCQTCSFFAGWYATDTGITSESQKCTFSSEKLKVLFIVLFTGLISLIL